MGKWGVSIQMPPHKIRHLIPALMIGARTRKGQFQRCIRGLCGGKHRIRAGLSTGGEKNIQSDTGLALVCVHNDAVHQCLGHFTRKAAVRLPLFLDRAAQIFHTPDAFRKGLLCVLQGSATAYRSAFGMACARFSPCSLPILPAPSRPIFTLFPIFFLHSFLLTGSDLPRGLIKQDFRSFLLCNYGIMNAQTERQCYLA